MTATSWLTSSIQLVGLQLKWRMGGATTVESVEEVLDYLKRTTIRIDHPPAANAPRCHCPICTFVYEGREPAKKKFLHEQEIQQRSLDHFLAFLDPHQVAQFECQHRLTTVASNGKAYILGFEDVIGEDNSSWCAITSYEDSLLWLDELLEKKLLLEADVDRFFSIANRLNE